MRSSTLDHGSFDWGPRLLALWAGILAGPLAWATLLETNYTLSYVACEQRHTWMLHLATVGALAIVWLAAYGAWRAAPVLGDHEIPSEDPNTTALLRARFMGIGALGLSAFFTLVILATEIPAAVLNPCSW